MAVDGPGVARESGGPQDSGPGLTIDSADSGLAESGDTEFDSGSVSTDVEVILLPRSTDGLVSPYNLRLFPDLDGDGLPQVVAPSVDSPRGVEVWDVAGARAWAPVAVLPGVGDSAQASQGVGDAGDLDGDGLHEVIVVEYVTDDRHEGEYEAAWRWWSVASDREVGRLTWDEATGPATPIPPSMVPLPDVDGDGLPECAVVTGAGTEIFRGSSISPSMTWDDAWVHASMWLGIGTEVADDHDGDGIDEVLFSDGGELFVLSSTAWAAGRDILPGDAVAVGETAAGDLSWTLLDIDGDGLRELFTSTGSLLRGYSGSELAAALRRERVALTPADAWVTYEGERSDAFGWHIAPWGAADANDLVLSDYFEGQFRTLDGDAVRAGGEITEASVTYTAGDGWYSYPLAGGHDLDGNGRLDIVVGATGTSTGLDTMEIRLSL